MSHNYTFGFTIAGNFALVVVYYIEESVSTTIDWKDVANGWGHGWE